MSSKTAEEWLVWAGLPVLADEVAELRTKAALVDEMRDLSNRQYLPGVFADVLFDVGGDED